MNVIRSYIRELILEAFSLGTIRKRTLDFQAEDPNVTDDEAKYYLDRFSDVQNSPYVQDKDIQRYSWRNRTGPDGKSTTGLKDFIDSKWSTRSFYEPVNTGDLEPIHQSEDGSLQIFLGDKREKCVTFRKNFEGRTGKNYSWCISRSDTSNLFSSYRFRHDEPVFYYIFDFERKTSDPLHACVIYVTSEGKYWLSNATNVGDKEYTWGSLAGMMPKIADLQGILKHIPVAQEEKEKYERHKLQMSDEEFSKLTRDQKEDYITAGHILTKGQIRNLWRLPDRVDLINKYCNHHKNVFLPLDVWKKLPEATRKVVRENIDQPYQLAYRVHYLQEKKIEGDFYPSFESVDIELPQGLEVSGNLLVYNRDSLPENLKVGGVLSIRTGTISQFPPGLKCNGLELGFTPITEIRDDIFWSSDIQSLILTDSAVVKIPNISSVKSLNISRSNIQKLPEGLQCDDLYAFRSSLVELPAGFTANTVDLSSSKNLKELPENMNIKKNLTLYNTEIQNLPRGLQVGRDIKIDSTTKITSLPLDLKLGGKIEMSGGKISEYPFYKDYLKILKRNRAESKKKTVGESTNRLRRFIRNTISLM